MIADVRPQPVPQPERIEVETSIYLDVKIMIALGFSLLNFVTLDTFTISPLRGCWSRIDEYESTCRHHTIRYGITCLMLTKQHLPNHFHMSLGSI